MWSSRDTLQYNCNMCECQVSGRSVSVTACVTCIVWQVSQTKPGCMEVMCSTDKCMLEEEVIHELEEGERRSLYTWKPGNATQFWGKTLEEGIKGKLGAERPDIRVTKKVW